MRDQQQFEARFEAAVGRYLEGAPVAVDALALALSISDRSRRSSFERLFMMSNPIKFVLIAALLATASLAVSLSAGQNVTPRAGCATPTPSSPTPPTSTMSPGRTAGPAVEFLWSATGPPVDPMKFAVSSAGIAGGGPIAIDPACRVWVSDTGHDRFAIFDPDGSFVEYWGGPGTGDGQFNMRSANNDGFGAAAFAPDGSFYVLDIGNYRIQHFGRDRDFLGSWGGTGTDPGHSIDPNGIAVDGNGVIYVLDDFRNVVERYDRNGTVLGSFAPFLSGLSSNGMALDVQGNIYVNSCCAAGNEVRKFAPDGTRLATIGAVGLGGHTQITASAVDAAGRVFAAASGPRQYDDVIRVYDPAGTLLTSFGTAGSGDGQFGHGWILGLALDGQGGLYATDGGGNRLEKFRLLPPLTP